jgi:4-hydroxybenzoate polyprenyltransferase
MVDRLFAAVRRWLLWSNLLMAGCAAGWAIVTLRALALPADGVLIVLAFVLAVAFYNRDRLDKAEQATDRATMPQRTAWMQRHALVLRSVVWLSLFVAVLLLIARPAALPPILIGLGFALTYTLRWLPWRGRRVGWKHLPGFKMPFVAGLWTLLTVMAPAAAYGRVWARDTWLLAAAVCALIMLQILLNDLRDVAGDRASGTASLPVLLGESAARRVGYALAVAATLLALPVSPLPFLLTALYSSFLLWRYRREQDTCWRWWIEVQGLIAALAALVGG